MTIRRSDASLVSDLGRLGVTPGGVLLVHSAFSEVGLVETGPLGFIAALELALGPRGTLVMPSWTGDDDSPFVPEATPPATDLGIVPGTFWRLPGVVRNSHPFAFAARGPEAEAITADPLILPPHQSASPLGRVLQRDGEILLVGVGHDANTMIHLAEILAGVPYRRRRHCAVSTGDGPKRVDYGENDHCCQRFALVDGWLRAANAQSEGTIGRAHARLMRAQAVVDAVRPRLEAEPLRFLHPPESGCEECDDARASLVT